MSNYGPIFEALNEAMLAARRGDDTEVATLISHAVSKALNGCSLQRPAPKSDEQCFRIEDRSFLKKAA